MDPRHPLLLTVRALTTVIDATDAFSRGRSLRVSRYAIRVGQELGLDREALVTLELGALLHDLGRTALVNDVTTAPRRLDAGERALVQTHPTIGWEMLKDIPGLEAAAEIVYAHHEQPNGKGYPRALAGDAIPLGARIVMTCAAYDAMIEDRPYRRGLTPSAACRELEAHSGSQFDRQVVTTFVMLHDLGKLWQGFTAEELELYVRRDEASAA